VSISAKVLRAAGHSLFINEHYEDAITYYEKSNKLKEDDETLIFMAIAYYKTGKRRNDESYIKKALLLLQQITENSVFQDEKNYYLMLIYSNLKRTKELNEVLKVISSITNLEDKIYIAGNETYIVKKSKVEENYIRDLKDPVLIELLKFLIPYLKELYPSMSNEKLSKLLAKKINNAYDEIMKRKKQIKMLYLFIAIIIAVNFINTKKKLDAKTIESMPVVTRYVIKEFLKKMGVTYSKENVDISLPYIVENKKAVIEKAIEIINTIDLIHEEDKQNIKDLEKIKKDFSKGLYSNLSYLSNYDYQSVLNTFLSHLESKKPISFFMLKKALINFIRNLLKETKTQLSLFYSEEQIPLIMKLLISDLNIEQKIKTDLLLYLNL
jgi:tetratricopeptide (TPR) repeat protein